tara:strand:+ start:936 stop:1100 length:165 start_codon:yes stop_codon:yes gene_type:complete
MEILLANWSLVLLGLIAFLDIIVSLTPSKKDDKVVGYLKILVNAFAGRKKRKKR